MTKTIKINDLIAPPEMKLIPEFENYAVSTTGKVFRVDKDMTPLYEVKQYDHPTGYKYVNLYNNGISKSFTVHRLVAKAFIPNESEKPQVDHIDRVRHNNDVSNLRWATALENAHNTSSYNFGVSRAEVNRSIIDHCKIVARTMYGIRINPRTAIDAQAMLDQIISENESTC